MNDPYSVLGLDRSASKEDASKKFKSLAKECHPDLHPNNPEKEKRFKEINDAYDRIKSGDVGGSTGSHSFHDFDFGFTPFSDIFGNMAAEALRRQRNSDLHLECHLTLEEAFQGKTMNIHVSNMRDTPRVVPVTVPPGVRNGMRVNVAKGGNQTNMTMPPGDLYLTVRVVQHERFRTDNSNNLLTVVPVSVFDVLLGRPVEVVNLDGKSLTVNIPSVFDSSRKLRLAGQGMPDPFTKVRGDLLVELFVTYPLLTEKQRSFVEQAAAGAPDLSGETV